MSDPAEQASPQTPPAQIPPAPVAPWTPPGAPPFGDACAAARLRGSGGLRLSRRSRADARPQACGPYAGAPSYAMVPSPAAGPPAQGRALGLVALILALVAVIGSSVVGAVAGTSAGLVLGPGLVYAPLDYSADLSMYSPVRGWVLVGEIAFWVGTVLGTWALIQGIVAAVKRRGRGSGIAAIVVAAIGPLVFFTVTWGAFAVGMATSAASGI